MKKHYYKILLLSLLQGVASKALSQIKADFSISVEKGCSPLLVEFKEKSKGKVVKWFWSFGNGNTSIVKSPFAAYVREGFYSVKLVVEDENGNKDSIIKENLIEVLVGPQSHFSIDTNQACPFVPIQFFAESEAGGSEIIQHSWDFGDGNIVQSKNPTHAYSNGGLYAVTLFARDKNGCQSVKRINDLIKINPNPNPDFKSDIQASCTSPLDVKFSFAGVVPIAEFAWKFGNGEVSNNQNPSMQFYDIKKYDISLWVKDKEGCVDSILKKNFIAINYLESDFTFKENISCEHTPIKFTTNIHHNLSEIKYEWDFGNGLKSSLANPVSNYTENGQYDVMLIVSDVKGICKDTIKKKLNYTVFPKQEIVPIIDSSGKCDFPATYHFKPSKEVKSAHWRFSGNYFDFSIQTDARKIYRDTGVYGLNYSFIDNNNCEISGVIPNIIVVEAPILNISGQTKGCIPFSSNISYAYLRSKFGIETSKWFMDNKLTSEAKSFQAEFKNIGNGKVFLEVENSRGCKYSDSTIYSFGVKTTPDFEVAEPLLCIGQMQTIINKTDTSQNQITSVVWSFFNHPTSFSRTVLFNPYTVGSHNVSLTTYNYGCSNSITKNNIFTVLGPYADLNVLRHNCGSRITLSAELKGTTRFMWKVNGKNTDSVNKVLVFNMQEIRESIVVELWATNENTICKDVVRSVTLNPAQEVKTSFAVGNYGCAQTAIQFTNTSLKANAARYFWYVNGKAIPTYNAFEFHEIYTLDNINYTIGHTHSYSPNIHFTKRGTYRVRLISSANSCLDTFDRTIEVDGPEEDFEIIPDGKCLPLKVTLKVKNLDANGEKKFEMGDGNTVVMTQNEATYIYTKGNKENVYRIIYKYKSDGGCSMISPTDIEVYSPSAKIGKTIHKICMHTKVKLRAIHSNTEYFSYFWEPEPGIILKDKEFNYIYNNPGKYKINLTITNQFGCFQQISDSITVTYGTLVANFEADNYVVDCPPLKVTFQNNTQPRPDAKIVSYLWAFGDGTISTLQNPQKIYTLPGKYTVSLTVKDELGCMASRKFHDYVVVNGSHADFSFSTKEGCVPMEVSFKLHSNNPSLKFMLDLGDGTIAYNPDTTKIYERAGYYLPVLFISDTFGCSYGKPAYTPLSVWEKPIAAFTSSGICMHKQVEFKNLSKGLSSPLRTLEWNINNAIYFEQNPLHTFVSPGLKNIKLNVTDRNGCIDSVGHSLYIFGFEPEIFSTQGFACFGDEVFLIDRSKSDTTIIFKEWKINEKETFAGNHIRFTANQAGSLNVSLYLQNMMGCDTLFKQDNVVFIGDTIPSKPNSMLHVSVVDDFSTQIKFNSSVEPDFMKYQVFHLNPLFGFEKIFEVENKSDTLHTYGGLNNLVNSQCFTVVQENFCGLAAKPDEGDLHCTINLFGELDTNASILHWNHYVGWNEIEKYVIYKENEGKFDSIAEVAGQANTYIDSLGCFTDLFSYKIKAIEKHGNNEKSMSDTCRVKPIYHNIVPPPYLLFVSVPDNQNTEIAWEQVKYGRNAISSFEIHQSSNNINYSKVGTSVQLHGASFYDMSPKEVGTQNYFYKIKVVDLCGDVSDFSNFAKTILLKSELTLELKPKLFWNKYQFWEEGVAYYIIEQMLNNGEFIEIGRSEGADDTFFVHNEVAMSCFDNYIYRVIALRNPSSINSQVHYDNIRSISNNTQAPVKSKLYVPNAFSPNGDMLNDYLEFGGAYIKSSNVKVFNRWGEKLFDSNACFAKWDGTYKGEAVPEGVYLYVVQAHGADNVVHNARKALTLLR